MNVGEIVRVLDCDISDLGREAFVDLVFVFFFSFFLCWLI